MIVDIDVSQIEDVVNTRMICAECFVSDIYQPTAKSLVCWHWLVLRWSQSGD